MPNIEEERMSEELMPEGPGDLGEGVALERLDNDGALESLILKKEVELAQQITGIGDLAEQIERTGEEIGLYDPEGGSLVLRAHSFREDLTMLEKVALYLKGEGDPSLTDEEKEGVRALCRVPLRKRPAEDHQSARILDKMRDSLRSLPPLERKRQIDAVLRQPEAIFRAAEDPSASARRPRQQWEIAKRRGAGASLSLSRRMIRAFGGNIGGLVELLTALDSQQAPLEKAAAENGISFIRKVIELKHKVIARLLEHGLYGARNSVGRIFDFYLRDIEEGMIPPQEILTNTHNETDLLQAIMQGAGASFVLSLWRLEEALATDNPERTYLEGLLADIEIQTKRARATRETVQQELQDLRDHPAMDPVHQQAVLFDLAETEQRRAHLLNAIQEFIERTGLPFNLLFEPSGVKLLMTLTAGELAETEPKSSKVFCEVPLPYFQGQERPYACFDFSFDFWMTGRNVGGKLSKASLELGKEGKELIDPSYSQERLLLFELIQEVSKRYDPGHVFYRDPRKIEVYGLSPHVSCSTTLPPGWYEIDEEYRRAWGFLEEIAAREKEMEGGWVDGLRSFLKNWFLCYRMPRGVAELLEADPLSSGMTLKKALVLKNLKTLLPGIFTDNGVALVQKDWTIYFIFRRVMPKNSGYYDLERKFVTSPLSGFHNETVASPRVIIGENGGFTESQLAAVPLVFQEVDFRQEELAYVEIFLMPPVELSLEQKITLLKNPYQRVTLLEDLLGRLKEQPFPFKAEQFLIG